MKYAMLSAWLLLSAPLCAADRDPLIIRHADRFEYFDREGVKHQRLIGHVEILYKETKIFADTAVNYHNLERMEFNGRAKLDYGTQVLKADRITYFKKDSSAAAQGRVSVTDKEKRVTITGGRGDYSRQRDESRIFVKPVLTRIDSTGKDTLTIVSVRMRHLGKEKRALAEDSVIITQGKIRATCNRCDYFQEEEKVVLLDSPQVFHEKDALKGDTIILFFVKDALDRMVALGNARGRFLEENKARPDSAQITVITGDTLIAHVREGSMDRIEVIRKAVGLNFLRCDTTRVNRLLGKYMEFFLSRNALDSTHVAGNAQSLYYYEERGEKGRNETSGDTLNIYFANRQVSRITASGAVKGVYFKK
jgi:lipopolysaccharide export system protein LptA